MNIKRPTANVRCRGRARTSAALRPDQGSRPVRQGVEAFTLLELMLAVTLLAIITVVTYMGFSTVSIAWQRGTDMADKLHHADFVVEQLVMALRSTYYPAGGCRRITASSFATTGMGRTRLTRRVG